jgi:hypothetical protein
MGLPRFFKLAKPKSFNYVPVFYDEREEKLKERIEKAADELGIEQKPTGDYKPRLARGTMRSYLKKAKKTDRYSSIRLIVIIAILLIIAYYIIVNVYSK